MSQELLLNGGQVAVGEDETNVVLNERGEGINLGVGLSVLTEDLPDHGLYK